MKRWPLVGLVATVAACATGSIPTGQRIVWPPSGIPAPGEVEWVRAFDHLRPAGSRRLLRAIAGANRQQTDWLLLQPVAVAIGEEQILTVDTRLGQVYLSEHDGGAARRLELPETFTPVAAASDPGGRRFFVADRAGGAVLVFDRGGKLVERIVPQQPLATCGGIGAAANGDLLLTDADAGAVVRMNRKGVVVARTAPDSLPEPGLNRPGAVVEGPDGTVWVVDTLNFRILALNAELKHDGGFGRHGDATGTFALPKGLAVDPDGHLYVSDGRFDVIQVFDSDGRLLLVVGAHGRGPGELWSPAGIACDRRGNLAVADTGNHRVQLLRYGRRSSDQ